MSSTQFHEDPRDLSDATKNMHRAIVSLMEELEAVDWYNQRADACTDPELKAVLEHNRDEEIEHAAMCIEWLRRRLPALDDALKTYLFTTVPVTEGEEAATGEGASSPAAARPRSGLGIGKL